MLEIMEGSHAIALAVKAARPNVVAAYPITPQTHIVEDISQLISNGDLDARYVKVESEHSAMSVCIGASATGARTCGKALSISWASRSISDNSRLDTCRWSCRTANHLR